MKLAVSLGFLLHLPQKSWSWLGFTKSQQGRVPWQLVSNFAKVKRFLIRFDTFCLDFCGVYIWVRTPDPWPPPLSGTRDTGPYIHACMHARIHPSIHPSIRMHPSIHPSIHAYIHTYITYLHTYIPTYQHTNIPPPQATGGGPEEPYHHHRPQGGDQKNHTTIPGHRGGGPWGGRGGLGSHGSYINIYLYIRIILMMIIIIIFISIIIIYIIVW